MLLFFRKKVKTISDFSFFLEEGTSTVSCTFLLQICFKKLTVHNFFFSEQNKADILKITLVNEGRVCNFLKSPNNWRPQKREFQLVFFFSHSQGEEICSSIFCKKNTVAALIFCSRFVFIIYFYLTNNFAQRK